MRIALFLSLVTLFASSEASAQVVSWSLAKGPTYQQTANNTSPAAPAGWLVIVDVETTAPGDASAAVVSGGGIVGTKPLVQDGEFWCLEEQFPSQALMNATWPSSGTYTITISGGSLGTLGQTATFGTESYPVAPYLTGFDWSELQNVHPGLPFTLDWSDPGTSLQSTGLIFLYLAEALTGNDVLDTVFPKGTTSTVLPANTLSAGTDYEGSLVYANGQQPSGAGGFGASGLTGHISLLELDATTLAAAGVTWRNAGSNPDSYAAAPPMIGSTWTASVNLGTTGHGFAMVFGMSAPSFFPLLGGQTLLIGGTQAFKLKPQPGPIATWSSSIPNDTALIGQVIYSQAVHFTLVKPFALSNAQDLLLGL